MGYAERLAPEETSELLPPSEGSEDAARQGQADGFSRQSLTPCFTSLMVGLQALGAISFAFLWERKNFFGEGKGPS